MKRKITLPGFIFCLLLLLGGSAEAANVHWTNGAGDFKWSTVGNWSATTGGASCGCVPVLNDDVYIDPPVGSTFTITNVPTITINSFTIDNNNNVTLKSTSIAAANTITDSTDLSINTGSLTTILNTSGNVTFSLYGNIINNTTFTTVGLVQFIGTKNATITGGGTCTFNYAGGNALTLNKSNSVNGIQVGMTGGTINALSARFTLAGGAANANYYFVNCTFNCTGLCQVQGFSNMQHNFGTFNSGSLTIVGGSTVTYNSTSSGGTISGNVTNTGSVIVNTASTITVNGNFTNNGGTVDAGISTINIGGFFNNTGSSTLAGSTSIINITGNFSNGSLATFNGNSCAFNLKGNWINDGTFNAGTSTVTFKGTGAQGLGATTNNPTTFNNLTLNNTSTLSQGISLNTAQYQYVNGVFTLTNGKLTSTSLNLLTLNAAATVSGGNNASYVYGPMAKIIADNTASTFNFPVGKDIGGASGEILPIGMTGFSGAGLNVTFTAELKRRNVDFTATPYAGYTKDAWVYNYDSCEYWTLSRSSNTLTSQIALNWQSAFCVVNQPSELRVLNVNSGSILKDLDDYSLAINPTFVGSSAAGTVTSTSLSSYYTDTFTLGSMDTNLLNPLPIDLITFTAKSRHNDVLVEWTTSSEVNNAFFTIEKEVIGASSSVRSSFAPIAIVDGAGNSTTTHHYQIIDDSPLKAKQWWNYYRLKQTDFDGNFRYYTPVAVKMDPSATLSIYPSVSSGLFYYTGDWQNGDVTVYSTDGRKVFNTTITNETSSLDLSTLPQGLYFVSIQTTDGIVENRIVKTSEK